MVAIPISSKGEGAEDHPLHRGRTASGPLSRRPGPTRGCCSPKSPGCSLMAPHHSNISWSHQYLHANSKIPLQVRSSIICFSFTKQVIRSQNRLSYLFEVPPFVAHFVAREDFLHQYLKGWQWQAINVSLKRSILHFTLNHNFLTKPELLLTVVWSIISVTAGRDNLKL